MRNLDELEKLALSATPGPWHRSERPAGPFWHIYSDHTVGGRKCRSGRQSIGSMNAENKRTGSKAYAEMFDANSLFVAAANPATILAVIAEVRALRNLESAVLDHRAMYEGTSDEDNMSALSIGDAIAELDAARKEEA